MSTLERVREALEGLELREVEAADGLPTLLVDRAAAAEALERLRDRAGFETPTIITAVDRFPAVPRFEVLWQLLSLAHKDRVRLKCPLADEEPSVPTVTHLWPGAAYMERECYDLFGIRFDGHEGLKRLLMPEDYDYHPLRKDFPHQGIEPDRLYKRWDRARRRGDAQESA